MTSSVNNATESITVDELTTVVKNLKSSKAAGEYSVDLELFK
jgi:hypothetical protein